MRKHCNASLALMLCLTLLAGPLQAPVSGTARMRGQGGLPPAAASNTSTPLPDGTWLLLGGDGSDGPQNAAAIRNPWTGVTTPLAKGMIHTRSGHSATLLPDGTVLVLGGIGRNRRVVQLAEVFNPETGRFDLFQNAGVTLRAFHSATVLTDGLVLIAGGISDGGEALDTAELWDFRSGALSVLSTRLNAARVAHTATLLANGQVLLWGGFDKFGNALSFGELYEPFFRRFFIENRPLHTFAESGEPRIEATLPEDRAEDVPVNELISVRFSNLAGVTSVNTGTVLLSSVEGNVNARVTPAEAGRVAFLTPKSPLAPGTTYTLVLEGVRDQVGRAVQSSVVSFTTAGDPTAGEIWIPGTTGDESDWQSDQGQPKAKSLPPLQAPPGTTALAGQVLRLNGHPLKGIDIRVGYKSTVTDESGRFLLLNPPTGERVMYVNHGYGGGYGGHDGHGKRSNKYCSFEMKVPIEPGITNVWKHTIWLPVEDVKNATPIPVPTTKEVVATHPQIPGLEVRIPAGVILKTMYGEPLRYLSITPVPVDRTPLPLPANTKVPLFFVFQAHRAEAVSVDGKPNPGIRVIYPNVTRLPAGSRMDLWNHDAAGPGWYIYGNATVSADRRQFIPENGASLQKLTCIVGPGLSNASYLFKKTLGGLTAGDPVDLATGLFVYEKTDLVLPDTIPIVFSRTYRQNDTVQRGFGPSGFSHSYDIFMMSSGTTVLDIWLPGGGLVHFDRDESLPAGTWGEHLATPTAFYKAKYMTSPSRLVLKDGTTYKFGGWSCCGGSSITWVDWIEDRYGNRLTLEHVSPTLLLLTRIISPNGRWVRLTWDTTSTTHPRIAQVRDNIGRVVHYEYDVSGRLWRVIDPAGGVTEYTYDSNARITSIKDARGITYMTLEYDSNGKVVRQTMADGAMWEYAYTLGTGGKVIQTDVTYPNGAVRRVTFNLDGYATSDTFALNQPEQQSVSFERQSGSNLPTAVTDPLNRRTEYAYDTAGNVTSVTRLVGTANPVTTTFTYEPAWHQVASVTDPLSHTTEFDYDTAGNLTTVTDPLSHATTFTYNTRGQPLTVTDALNNTTTFAYDPDWGDLVSVTDPLSRTVARYFDHAGRLVKLTDPLGKSSRTEYDLLNQVTKVIDPLAGETSFTYDLNGNLLSVTDARSNTTSYTHDNMDRLATRTDPLTRAESYQYDLSGNLVQHTDRRGKVATYTYDKLDRMTFAGFGTVAGPPPQYESTITYTYDGASRLNQVVDSVSGTVQLSYDDLDQLTSEITPQGTVSYTYDAAGRRTGMTASGQSQTTYTYDNADRLTQITQGSQSVQFAYDNANRRMSLTLPNGIVMAYAYDSASQLSAITYTLTPNQLGNLTYAYDNAGRRVSMGGTFARTNLPQALTSAAYDAANQLTEWGATTFSYDANGNLANNGTNAFTWNARNQLTSITGGFSASFQYDASGRRASKTVAGVTTGFLHDGLNPVQEQLGGGVNANLLVGGIDEFFSRTDQLGTHSFLTDALGSSLALADGSGNLLNQYTYEPFGNTAVTGSVFNPFQYTGRENDGTGLFYYRARYYSPALNRFISQDPSGLEGGSTNLYLYVLNSPANLTDPSGEVPIILAIAALGGVFGAVDQALTAYGQGKSAGEIASAAGKGAVAGASAAVVGTGVAALTRNALLIGASSALSYDLALGALNQQLPGTSDLVIDTALGAVLGPLAKQLTPAVSGPGPRLLVPRTLVEYLRPKTIQLLKNVGLDGLLGTLSNQVKNMLVTSGRKSSNLLYY